MSQGSIEEMVRKDYFENRLGYRELAEKYRKSFSELARILNPERRADERADEIETLKAEVEKLKKELDEVVNFVYFSLPNSACESCGSDKLWVTLVCGDCGKEQEQLIRW